MARVSSGQGGVNGRAKQELRQSRFLQWHVDFATDQSSTRRGGSLCNTADRRFISICT
jgi:Uri superfamily endonuclease